MKVYLTLLLTLYFSILGYGQGEVIIIDSKGEPIEVGQEHPIFLFNNGKDTIKLNPLNNNYNSDRGEMISFEIDDKTQNLHSNDTIPNTIKCLQEKITFIDSIDINDDGYKEIILARECRCSSSPPIPGPYGVGISQHLFKRFEIWDIKTQKPIIEIENVANGSIAITTNVQRNFGYQYQVKINQQGTLHLSNLYGYGNTMVMGNYTYDSKSGTYLQEL